MRRVVVTGMAGVTSLGSDWAAIKSSLAAGKTGIRKMDDWDRIGDMNTRLAGPIENFSVKDRYPRKKLRSMGPVSQLAVYATEQALINAELIDDPILTGGRTGIAYGSSFGSTEPVTAFAALMTEGSMRKLTATSYVHMMSHTAPVNIGVFFGITGRIIPTSSACTSGSQGIGYAYESIKYGLQDVMIAGGAEELCPSMAAVFDSLFATSTRNDEPHLSPRPYDRDRDGLVVGEGAGTLILEEYERAKARGAKIYAEVVGFGTNSDGNHITQPTASTMERALRSALTDANLNAADIGFVSGHGTATERGDIAESHATHAVVGNRAPLHSLKSYFGHTLGACGALEAWLGIEMMRSGWFAHTANLDNIDPECADLDYVTNSGRSLEIEHLMSNNFAFGGINTSLIFKRWH